LGDLKDSPWQRDSAVGASAGAISDPASSLSGAPAGVNSVADVLAEAGDLAVPANRARAVERLSLIHI
jgi:hypothetical protein